LFQKKESRKRDSRKKKKPGEEKGTYLKGEKLREGYLVLNSLRARVWLGKKKTSKPCRRGKRR